MSCTVAFPDFGQLGCFLVAITLLKLFLIEKHLPFVSGHLTFTWSPLDKSAGFLSEIEMWRSSGMALYWTPLYFTPSALSIYLSLFTINCTQGTVYSFRRLPFPSFTDIFLLPKINAKHRLLNRFAFSSHFRRLRPSFLPVVGICLFYSLY